MVVGDLPSVADTAKDNRFCCIESIQSQSIQAAVCCPLICRKMVLGALYLDTQVDVLSFQEEDLALLSIIATHAAIAIENAVLIQHRFDTACEEAAR